MRETSRVKFMNDDVAGWKYIEKPPVGMGKQ